VNNKSTIGTEGVSGNSDFGLQR